MLTFLHVINYPCIIVYVMNIIGIFRSGYRHGHREFPFWRWQIPVPLLEKSRKFPFRINDLFTRKHVYYCQKVVETDSFLPTTQNSIVIAFKFTREGCMRETMLISLVQFYLRCHFYNRALRPCYKIPVLKVINFRSSLEKSRKFPFCN